MRHDREVDCGLCDFVDVVGQGVERNVEDNLDDLRVVVASSLDRLQLGVRDVAARPDHLRRETHRGAGLRVRGAPFAVRGDLSRLLSAKVRAFIELAITTRDWKFVDV